MPWRDQGGNIRCGAGIGPIGVTQTVSHRFGFYHSGAHAGQILVAVTYPDMATRERAMQSMSEDADWKSVVGEIDRIAPLQESYLTVVTEEQ